MEPTSTIPLHEQLSDTLRERIQTRTWVPRQRIASEHELMETFHLSRGTVRRAIKTLVDEGLLVQRHGQGTFVAEPGVHHPSGERMLSFAASLREQGKAFQTIVLEQQVVPASEMAAAGLALEPGTPVLFLRRVRVVADEPVVCQESWLNLPVCPGLDNADFTTESAFDAVERCSGHRIKFSSMHYQAQAATKALAVYLRCKPGDPLLALEQTISLEDHVPVEWSTSWLREGQSVLGNSVQPDVAPVMGTLEGKPVVARDPLVGFGGATVTPDVRQPLMSNDEMRAFARDIRRQVVEFGHRYPDTPFHIGGSMSVAEILAVLLGSVMRTGKDGTPWEERDRLILSKAHACLALYPALHRAGFLSDEDLERGLFGPEAVIFKHPRRDPARGLECSGGSLGMGPGYAAGLAIAALRKGLASRVFCVVGDGECNEGAVWEAAGLAGHLHLGGLTIIVDVNGMQLDGPTATVLGSGSLAEKFASFDFETVEVDGHDVEALAEALCVRTSRPRAVIAYTQKGRGLSFAENCVEWHDSALDEDYYQQALVDLEAM